MSTWLNIFKSYTRLQDIAEILPQISEDDINEGVNILLNNLSRKILLNKNILRDIIEIIKLFYKYDGVPNINTLFDVDNIKNIEVNGILIDIITKIYDIELDDETIKQWASIKRKNIEGKIINNKRLLQYLKYSSKFLSNLKSTNVTDVSDLPKVLKGLIGQYIIEKYENKWLDENWLILVNKVSILENPNAIDFIKKHIHSYTKRNDFLIRLSGNPNPEVFEIIKDYCFNKNAFKSYSKFYIFLQNIAHNNSDIAIDFLSNYWDFFSDIENFKFKHIKKFNFSRFWNILSKNHNDKAINFFVEKCDEPEKWSILSQNTNSKVINIIDENTIDMSILQKWNIWRYSSHYIFKSIDLLLNNWDIIHQEINTLITTTYSYFYDYISIGISYFNNIDNKYRNYQKSLTDVDLEEINLNNYNSSKIIELLRNKWKFFEKYFHLLRSSLNNEDWIDLLKEKWNEVQKTERLYGYLASNSSVKAIQLLKEKFTGTPNNEFMISNNFFIELASNENVKAIELLKEKWSNIDDNLMLDIMVNLALNKNVKAIELLKEKWSNIDDNLMMDIMKNLASNKNVKAIELLEEKIINNTDNNLMLNIMVNLASNENSFAIVLLIQIKNSIINFNDNWQIWRILLKNPNEKVIPFIIDNWNIIYTNWGQTPKFWKCLFVNSNDKLIDFVEEQIKVITMNRGSIPLKFLLFNTNKKALRLFEKLFSIHQMSDFRVSYSPILGNYFKNPNIFDFVQIPLDNQYTKLL